MLIGATIETMAIGHGDESTASPETAVTREDPPAATPASPVAAAWTSPSAAPTQPVVADDSPTTDTNPGDATDPHGSSVRTTLGDLDRLSGVA